MPVYRITTRFHPIRLMAYARNNVEMSIEVENTGDEPLWTECDVAVPDSVSLAPDKDLLKGRIRVGIINRGEILTGRCRVYGNARSYPDTYAIKLTAFGFGRDGGIKAREEKRVELRCDQLGR
jgi:hypothetical protein